MRISPTTRSTTPRRRHSTFATSPRRLCSAPMRRATRLDTGKQMLWMRAMGEIEVADLPPRVARTRLRSSDARARISSCRFSHCSRRAFPSASIDHSMWWYRDIDVTKWHLYVQDTPTAAHGRGLSSAKVYFRRAISCVHGAGGDDSRPADRLTLCRIVCLLSVERARTSQSICQLIAGLLPLVALIGPVIAGMMPCGLHRQARRPVSEPRQPLLTAFAHDLRMLRVHVRRQLAYALR